MKAQHGELSLKKSNRLKDTQKAKLLQKKMEYNKKLSD